jgi:hypothetical protein
VHVSAGKRSLMSGSDTWPRYAERSPLSESSPAPSTISSATRWGYIDGAESEHERPREKRRMKSPARHVPEQLTFSAEPDTTTEVLPMIVKVHPALACHVLASRETREYSLWIFIRHLAPDCHGVLARELVELAQRVGWGRRSLVYNTLKSGNGTWWMLGADGRYRLSGFGTKNLLRRHGLKNSLPPKWVPLEDLRQPKDVFHACSFSSEPGKKLSREAICQRTGRGPHAQRRSEAARPVIKTADVAFLDQRGLTQAHLDHLGGCFIDRRERIRKRLPNSYQSPYPDAPCGHATRSRRQSRQLKGHGSQAGWEPRTRYFETVSAALKARQPQGLKEGERRGPVYVRSGEETVCVRLPELIDTSDLDGRARQPNWHDVMREGLALELEAREARRGENGAQ